MANETQDEILYLEDAGKTYWHETEAARLMGMAHIALFEVHRYMEKNLKREDWREVYGFRVSLGYIDARLRRAWDEQHRKIMDHLADQENKEDEVGETSTGQV